MSLPTDTIRVPEIILDDGTKLPEGCYDIDANNIEAVYRLSDGNLTIEDDGEVSGTDANDLIGEAPVHYMIGSGAFTGNIDIKADRTVTLSFKDNRLIGSKAKVE